MKIRIRETELFVVNLRARMPFRYGIVTMTRLPHLFVRAAVEIDGRLHHGGAADHLPPKWFTKNPQTAYRDDLAEMLEVIRHACDAAARLPAAATIFELWHRLYVTQKQWGERRGLPALLWNFGSTLIERAAIDAFCRATRTSFARAVRENSLGIQLGEIYPELATSAPRDLLPPEPLRTMIVRHTIGQTDPLTESDIATGDRVDDGLPEALETYLREDGVTHVKIKLTGEVERDVARLHRIVAVLDAHGGPEAFTLDGNENFKSVDPFRLLWEALHADEKVARLLQRLLFVEQPIHRDVALSRETAAALLAWEERPAMIIDESDGENETLATALASGYAGTSFKNCKGAFKGIANACLIAHRRRRDPSRPLHMSAEDLTNTGPIALQADLAVVATLGITHAERNGHHYFRGLSQFPALLQQASLAAHPDLFTRHPRGFPTLRIEHGRIAIGSVVDAPFGVAFEPDFSGCTRLDEWTFESLELPALASR